jgi:hypothetical protein
MRKRHEMPSIADEIKKLGGVKIESIKKNETRTVPDQTVIDLSEKNKFKTREEFYNNYTFHASPTSGIKSFLRGETSTDYIFAQGGYKFSDEGSLYVIKIDDVEKIGNFPRGWGKIKPGSVPFAEIHGVKFESWVPEGSPEDPYDYLIKNQPSLMLREN